MAMVKLYSPEDHLARIIRTDSKHMFVAFLRKQLENPGETVCDISQSNLLKSICLLRAVKCATALLEGETGVTVDINMKLEGGMTPLRLAARSLSFRLTELFLRHGARANMCDNDGSKDLAMLPLHLALNELCHHEYVGDWTPEKSIFKLFYIFCLRDLKEPLDTVKLLASKTEDVEKTSVHYDEVVQLAALVMVAWDRIVAPFIEKGIENSPIWQHIQRQLSIVCNQEVELLTTCDPNLELLEHYKNKKINLLAQLEIFRISAPSYDCMERYRHSNRAGYVARHEVPFDVAHNLFDKAGLVLTPDDVFSNDIKCLLPQLPKVVKDQLYENLEKKMTSRSRMSMSTKTPTRRAATDPLFPSMACSPARLFHTYQARNLSFGEPIKSQLPWTIQAVKPSLSRFLPSASICSCLLLVGRKCIK